MNRILLAAALALASAPGAMAQMAGGSPVVVELYTSQGCSSCPPADAVLGSLAEREDVIALALHVDYWDYIGWADGFADRAYSMRQRAYAKAAGASSVYTPQMIVNGTDYLVGVRSDEVAELIGTHSGLPSPVTLELTRNGDMVRIRAVSQRPLDRGALVQIVRYLPSASVAIERGENAGRIMEYSNIVQSWKPVVEWDGQSELAVETPAPGPEPTVVIIQEPGPGAILAAARLR
jgi:hypothetical protein